MIEKIKDLYSQVFKVYKEHPLVFLLILGLSSLEYFFLSVFTKSFNLIILFLLIGFVGFKYELVNAALKDKKPIDVKKLSNKFVIYWQKLWGYHVALFLVSIILSIFFSFFYLLLWRRTGFNNLEVLEQFKDQSNLIILIFSLIRQYFSDPSSLSIGVLNYLLIVRMIMLAFSFAGFIYVLIVQMFVFTRLSNLKKAFSKVSAFIKDNLIFVLALFILDSLVLQFLNFPLSLWLKFDQSANYAILINYILTLPNKIWYIFFTSGIFILTRNYFYQEKLPPDTFTADKFKLRTRDVLVVILLVIISIIGPLVKENNLKDFREVQQEDLQGYFPSDVPIYEFDSYRKKDFNYEVEGISTSLTLRLRDWTEKDKVSSYYQTNLMNEGWEIIDPKTYNDEMIIIKAIKDSRKLEIKKTNSTVGSKIKGIEIVEKFYASNLGK